MPFSEVPDTPGAPRSVNGASGSTLTGFWTATPGSPTQYWSPEMFDLLGCRAPEVIPSAATWLAAVHPDDRAAVAALWEDSAGDTESVLFRVVQPCGSIQPLTARRHATTTGDGAPATLMGIVQHRAPKEPLEERLRLFESVVVNANDAVVITEAEPIDGPEGPRIVYVNEAFLRNTGYSAGEVIGQTPRMFQGPDTDRATLATIRTALERWEPVRAELLNYRKDGTAFWVEVEIVPVADSDGWYTHWVSVQRDVTERKAAEQRLEASEQRFRGLVANLPGLVYRCTYDTAWDTLYMSEGILDLSGYSRKEFEELNLSFKDIVVPADLPRIRAAVRAAVAAGQAYEIEYRMRHRDGTTRWVLDKGQATIDEHGSVAWLDGVMFDITARKEAEERLRLMETAVEDTSESVLVTDTELDRPGPRIVHVNPGFERLTGYTAEEAIGQTPRILQGEETDPDLLVHLREQLEAGQPFFGETVNYRKDGTPFINEWSISPARNDKGEITHFVAVQRDVTEQREYENRIREALEKTRELSDLKTQFISMTSHEFRTPMGTILASAELLERYGARWAHDKQVTHLRRIQSAVHTMRELLDDVLVIGRSDAGKLAMHPERLDPAAVIGAIVDEVRHGEGHEHTITLDTDEAPAVALADAGLIRHACTNLLSNAVKYSEPGSTICVRVWAADEALQVTVADDGIGIPEEDQERLFDSFHRAGNVGDVSGTGLGLAIVQRAVAAHQGQIAFESEVGVGSTFHITLPLTPQDTA